MPKRKDQKQPPCSICGHPIDIQFGTWKGGHNAEPVNSGRCCTRCNDTVVLPRRIADFYSDPRYQ